MQPPGDPHRQQPELPPAQDPFAPPQPVPVDPYQTPYVDPHQTPYAYPATEYGVPQYHGSGYPAATGAGNAYGILALILGIVSIPMMCCSGSGLLFGVPAVVLGILGIRMAHRGRADNKGLSIAGVVCGGVGTAGSLAFWTLIGLGSLPATFS